MKAKIKLFPDKIMKLTQTQLRALELTGEQLRHEIITEQVIPFDEGTLQNVQTYVDTKELRSGNIQIVHDTPYAARLYFNPEYNFSHDINRNAKGEWWDDYLNGALKDRPRQIYSLLFKNESGGIIK